MSKPIAERHHNPSEIHNCSTTTECSFLAGKPHMAPPAPPTGFRVPVAALPGTVEEPVIQIYQQSDVTMKDGQWEDVKGVAGTIPVATQASKQSMVGIPVVGPVLMGEPVMIERSPQDILRTLTSVYVKQKIQPLELLTGCEIENVYQVFRKRVVTTEDNERQAKKDGQMLFKCKEKSGWCVRNCVGAACRPFSMTIKCKYTLPNGRKRLVPFLKLERPCACTFCCFSRPFIQVYYLHKDGDRRPDKVFLGKVVEPCSPCDVILDVLRGKEEQPIYQIRTAYFQCGLMFQCPCKGCNEVSFVVQDRKSRTVVGKIKKVFAGAIQEMFTNADDFTADFPAEADWQSKALLLAATVFIDYRYFEEKGQPVPGAD
ncbi:MAG: phospholipid scramblase-related protein [Candidatus Pacebacteria bacterium]|nr:phospholipid scramblase-related protein [Candidatus Paceibacterota bacterium]